MKAIGTSHWAGTWRGGAGTISTQSDALSEVPYTYQTRFADEHGVAPEELLAAAHASCFNQALANNLDRAGLAASAIATVVEVSYGITPAGRPTIEGSHIAVTATVPSTTDADFAELAERSARGCAISRVLSCDITVTATLR
ncbi:OsmC family peroxiredoxin [Gryllotalpicola protaetiae]|uniref:OsmC family peroxiredoxin n=1 Tax=Gryllotalpicola protaetiae TaxID=2419771 RepID=A0A387BS68_9MICO|nr:OsmC family peroxiredoxin [Gryllotalpicola protaetiae]AYG03900.1 OsmC family peroxiredoxin [Gryllotalpicola protaetiae]